MSEEKEGLISGSKFGAPIRNDPSWNGTVPGKDRSCNDVFFALLFLVMFGGMCVVAFTGFQQGKPELLVPSYVWQADNTAAGQYVQGRIQSEAFSYFQDAVAQVKADANVIIGAICMAIVLGFLWVQLLKWFTKAFIYLTLALGVSLVLFAGIYLVAVGASRQNKTLTYVGFGCFAIVLILILIIFCLRRKIALTAALMAETCKSVQHNTPGVFLAALLMVALFVGFVAIWVVQMVYLYSIPAPMPVNMAVGPNGQPDTTPEPQLFNTNIRYVMLFQVFGFLWTTSLLSAVYQMTVAGAVSSWYFSRTHASHMWVQPGSPSFTSMALAFTKSFGSLAFGSLIIAVVAFANYLLTRLRKANQNNRLISLLLCCLQCCLYCVQRFLEYMNKFAYIYIAMYGESFCASAKNVYNLMSRSGLSAVLVDMLGDMVLFVGKLFGTAASVLLTVAILHGLNRPEISIVSLIIVAVAAFCIFHLYAHIIGTGLDAVFVCYMEDLERNKENGRYFMSPETHQILQATAEKNKSNAPVNA